MASNIYMLQEIIFHYVSDMARYSSILHLVLMPEIPSEVVCCCKFDLIPRMCHISLLSGVMTVSYVTTFKDKGVVCTIASLYIEQTKFRHPLEQLSQIYKLGPLRQNATSNRCNCPGDHQYLSRYLQRL